MTVTIYAWEGLKWDLIPQVKDFATVTVGKQPRSLVAAPAPGLEFTCTCTLCMREWVYFEALISFMQSSTPVQ